MAIDATVDPYVLDGRVVTMGSPGVIDEGRVYIQGDTIRAVLPRSAPYPDGFTDAEIVKVGGTIFPGLIELHNHLSYNAIPLWDVPKPYAHSGSWQGTDEYKVAITKPAQVLANTAGNVEAIVRFVECRCLLGGVTTSQGLTLSSNQGIKAAYKGLVRNVESPLVEDLPAAGAKIGAPDKDLDKYLAKLQRKTCYLQHLSEGLGETPRNQFTGLQRNDGSWALHKSFCGIHSTALTPHDFEVLARTEHEGSIVWSPLSNLLLYGDTTNVKAVKDAGLPIALGSDWAPSGTKNLLGELKVARLVSDEQGGLFTDRELCEMITSTPAKILGWDAKLGTLQPDKLADLIVLDDTTENPFKQLVEARETSVTLVVIGGIPRVGQSRLMQRFGATTEEIRVGASKRLLNLAPTYLPDPTGGITLSDATEQLQNSLARLPELAEQLDTALVAGWTPGEHLHFGAGLGLADIGLPEGWQPPEFTVVLDFESEDIVLDPGFALATGNLVDWVDPMQLEGITVADDRNFFRKLASAGNLPSYIKNGLPPLYGESVPDIVFHDAVGDTFDASLRASRELRELNFNARDLRKEERLRIINEAIILLERHYVHLPMKRAMHAVDPLQRLRILRFEIEQKNPDDQCSDLDFHLEVAGIVNSLRDLHTTYRLPHPYRRQVAWLPFLIEEYEQDGCSKFMVSKIVTNLGPKTFTPGVEILHWNGTSIGRVIEQLARDMPGGNAAARRARAVNASTIRPLVRGYAPFEDWVTLQYRSRETQPRMLEYRQPWLVFEPSRQRRVLRSEETDVAATAFGIDETTNDVNQVRKLLYAGRVVQAEESALARGEEPAIEVADDEVLSRLPTHFRAMRVKRTGSKKASYAYLRIFSFNIDDVDAFVEEFERLLLALPKRGLIIDIRGNPGGLIQAAERILELISPRPIEPERAQFINTPANLALCRRHAPSVQFEGLSLGSWVSSIEKSVATGAPHSLGFPLTDPGDCNQRGQQYQNPVLLIVDGLCYSAADMFAAGFEDHNLGPIIGTDANTGAGGANVWSHALLSRLAGPESGLRRLPSGADLRVAIRRTLRVGPNAGELVEDLGIQPKVVRLTEKDLLEGNRDLIQSAIEILDDQPQRSLRLSRDSGCIHVRTKNVEWIETTSTYTGPDNRAIVRPLRGRPIEKKRALIQLNELPEAGPQTLEVIGIEESEAVVRARLDIGRD